MKLGTIIVVLLVTASLGLAAPNLKIGLGVWVWQMEKCEGGNVDKMVARAEAAHLRHVLIKVTEANRKKHTFGWARYNKRDKVVELARKLRAKGILVYAWGFHYPDKAMLGAQYRVIKGVLAMDCFDGFVYNVESAFANQHKGAESLLRPIWEFRNKNFPDKLLAYSTFCRVGRGAGGLMPLEEYSAYTDLAWPQVYWADFFPYEPGLERVTKSVDEEMFRAWLAKEVEWKREGKGYLCRPIIPTGHAYRKTSNTVRIPAREVAQFILEVGGYYGYNLYLWDKMGDEHWEMLKMGPRAWLVAHPEAPKAKQVTAKPEIKSVLPEDAPSVVEPLAPVITTEPDQPAEEDYHTPLWKILLVTLLVLWLLIDAIRSYPEVAKRGGKLGLPVKVVLIVISSILTMVADFLTVLDRLLDLATRGKFS